MKCAEFVVFGLLAVFADAVPIDSDSRSSDSIETEHAHKRPNRDDAYGRYYDESYHNDYSAYKSNEHIPVANYDLSPAIGYGEKPTYSTHYSEPVYYDEHSNHVHSGHDYIPSTYPTYDVQKSVEIPYSKYGSPLNYQPPLAPYPPQLNAHQISSEHYYNNYNDLFGPPFAPTLPLPTKKIVTIKTTPTPKPQNNNILSALLSISQSSSSISKPTTKKPVPAPKAHIYSINNNYPGYAPYHPQIGYHDPSYGHKSSSAFF